MSKKTIYKSYKLFVEGREYINKPQHNEKVEGVQKIIMDNRRITIEEVAEDVGLSFVHPTHLF